MKHTRKNKSASFASSYGSDATFPKTMSMPIAFEHTINLDSDIGRPCNHREEIAVLRNAGPNDIVHMLLNTGGGQLDTTIAIITAMRGCEASITTELVGDCCSAGTAIFLEGDIQVVNPLLGSFMIHQASHGYAGTDSDIYDYSVHSRKSNTSFIKEIYKGFLTDEEIELVITGKQVWLIPEEIRERCQARADFLQKLHEETECCGVEGDSYRKEITETYLALQDSTMKYIRADCGIDKKKKLNKQALIGEVMTSIYDDGWKSIIEDYYKQQK